MFAHRAREIGATIARSSLWGEMVRNLVIVFALLASTTVGAANWYDGSPSRVQHTCNFGLGSQVEDLVWTWVGFQDVDPGPRLPQTNETYYVRVVMGGLD